MKNNIPTSVIRQMQMANDMAEKMEPMLRQISASAELYNSILVTQDALQAVIPAATAMQESIKTSNLTESSLFLSSSLAEQMQIIRPNFITAQSAIRQMNLNLNRIERQLKLNPSLNQLSDIFFQLQISEVLSSYEIESEAPSQISLIERVKTFFLENQNLIGAIMIFQIALTIGQHYLSILGLDQAKFYLSLAYETLNVIIFFLNRTQQKAKSIEEYS